MNSLFLLLAATIVFVFGYRFYSKLLTIDVFRHENNYSIPTTNRPPEEKIHGFKRHLIFGHHLASLAAGAAVTGSVISLMWGWVPAFLWLVVGTVIAAGTYGLGSLWLSLAYPGLNPAEIAARLLGGPAYALMALLALLLLLVINAASVTLAAQLLSDFPGAVLPFWTIVVLAYFFGGFLRAREDFEIVPASLIAVTFAVMAIWLLGPFPLAFTGELRFDGWRYHAAFDATVVWILILFIYGYRATRLPMWRLIRPRGYLTALLLGIMLFLCFLAVVIDHPVLHAPEFNTRSGLPAPLPWLFITLTSGAVAGFHLLIANGVTARQLRHEADARYMGYGGALALGLLALSAIIIGGTGATGAAEWVQQYRGIGLGSLREALGIYIKGFARMAGGIGLDSTLAVTLATVVLLGLLVATLEAGLRVQAQLLASLSERFPVFLPAKEKTLIMMAVAMSAILALHQGHGRGGLAWWPLFGVADQLLAIIGFSLLALALRRRGKPVIWVMSPLIFLAAMVHWAFTEQMIQWWSADEWLLLGLGAVLLIVELGLFGLILKSLNMSRPSTTPSA